MDKADKSIILARIQVICSMLDSVGKLDFKQDELVAKQLYSGIANNIIEIKQVIENI